MSDPTISTAARRRIDVHHHVVPPQFVATTPMPVKVPDTDSQLQSMDDFGIQAAITSLTPRVFLNHPTRRREVARECNEFQAGLVRDHPARFGAFAVLPLPDVDDALAEVAYALDTLHLDGIGLFSSCEGRYLGDPLYDPLFEELNRRKALVFVHPSHCKAPDELNLHAPDSVVEYIFDSTRAIVNLLYTGVPRRCPDVRIIFSHGGGTVPYLTRRIAGLERSSNVPDVIGTLRTFYYDVASAMAPFSLRSLQELADPTHILWGSDLPFVHGEHLRAEVDEWEAYDGFNAAGRAAVELHNALRLFPRLAATSAAR
jgi:predicted TIM-barrel fold metal-dependent hydrolase